MEDFEGGFRPFSSICGYTFAPGIYSFHPKDQSREAARCVSWVGPKERSWLAIISGHQRYHMEREFLKPIPSGRGYILDGLRVYRSSSPLIASTLRVRQARLAGVASRGS